METDNDIMRPDFAQGAGHSGSQFSPGLPLVDNPVSSPKQGVEKVRDESWTKPALPIAVRPGLGYETDVLSCAGSCPALADTTRNGS
jgi:hypothetical protein